MVTRKQHYYPRSLLKHFSKDGKVVVYVRKANRVMKMSYSKVCFSKDTYESCGVVDNILENKLSVFEAKIGDIIRYIVNNWYKPNFEISKANRDTIYQYMWLQYLRTDAGRIIFVSNLDKIFSPSSRIKPIDLDEIQECQDLIERFNYTFKEKEFLECFLASYQCPENMKLHIAISRENLLTSDNPVIGTDNWKQIILPISPNLCIEFQDESINSSPNLIVELRSDKIRFLNEATINTANYYVISNQDFTLTQQFYLYSRFRSSSWRFGTSQFKDKNKGSGG